MMKSAAFLICILILSNGFSQKLIGYKLLPCQEAIGHNIYKDRIISQTCSGDTLLLEIGFTQNCAAELSPSLTSRNDTLFLELSNISEIYAACNCCYTMLLFILDTSGHAYKLFVNETEFPYSKSRYIDFPPREVSKKLLKNETNPNGQKIGYWKTETKNGYSISYFGNGSTYKNHPVWRKSFNSKGELREVGIFKVALDETNEIYYMVIEVEEYLKVITEIEAGL